MKKTPIRLGPLMILLLVISIALTTLALLTVTTARADRALSDRFAAAVSTRYDLGREASAFEAGVADGSIGLPAQGALPGGEGEVTVADGEIRYTLSRDGYTLVLVMDEETHAVISRQITKDWEYDDEIGDLWDGQGFGVALP